MGEVPARRETVRSPGRCAEESVARAARRRSRTVPRRQARGRAAEGRGQGGAEGRGRRRGDFQAAHDAGAALGPVGASVACKALGIHATYLVDDDAKRLARYERVGELAEAAIAALPDEPNSHYRYAFGMGRYSQGISIAKALKLGLATKVRRALDQTLALAPKHAEAHTALGLYHAEIIAKVGALVGGLTYGAKAAEAEKHLATALKLTPASPIAHLEHGNLLLLLHGDRREDDAAAAFEKAGKLKPRDAMEKLDADHARSQLE